MTNDDDNVFDDIRDYLKREDPNVELPPDWKGTRAEFVFQAGQAEKRQRKRRRALLSLVWVLLLVLAGICVLLSQLGLLDKIL